MTYCRLQCDEDRDRKIYVLGEKYLLSFIYYYIYELFNFDIETCQEIIKMAKHQMTHRCITVTFMSLLL